MSYTYNYPRPSVTADCVVIRANDKIREVLLIRRAHPPFRGSWALPGGFMEMEETLENTARRELLEETAMVAGPLKLIGIYDQPGRDPRGRTLSAAYLWLTDRRSTGEKAGSDAGEAGWFDVTNLPELAFDHAGIIHDALRMI